MIIASFIELKIYIMKKLLVLGFVIISFASFSQTVKFVNQLKQTKQSYLDRGYTLVDQISDSIESGNPLVSSNIDFDYNSYYIVLVQLDGCLYCDFDIKYVDDKEFMLPVNFEFSTQNDLKQGLYKFQNDVNKVGKFVVFLDSDLPYYANIFVFKKN